MAQTRTPRIATEHTLPPCPIRAGLLCLVLLLGWVLVVPSWATSAQVSASAGRFRLWHDVEDILTWTWGSPDGVHPLHTTLCLARRGRHWWRERR
jgi:hypothetical protein